MKPLLFWPALLIAASACISAAPVDPPGLATHLRQLASDLDSQGPRRVLAGLPATWDVATPQRRYLISAEPLRSLLQDAPSDGGIQPAKAWLRHVAQQLESFSLSPAPASAVASGRLNRILARPEFAAVRPPGAWELFRERIALWIGALIQKFFTFAAQHPAEGQILFWIIVAGAVGVLAAWLIQLWSRRDPTLRLPEPPSGLHSQTWEAWVRAAREAAGRGNSREAVRCTYWAAVSRLQEGRILPEGLTYTPREYLRLISTPPAAGLEPLTALTSSLERFWYGGRSANASDFETSLKHLEALGCKLD
jgi:hypothetical protein